MQLTSEQSVETGGVVRSQKGTGTETGMGIVELTVAMLLFAVSVMGLAAAMANTLKYTGSARQRSVAGAVATERMERIRNLDLAQVALYEQPAHSADENDPNHEVSPDGVSYRGEPLVVDLAAGAVKHIDDPVTSGTTEMYIYQFVTWVEGPGLPDLDPVLPGNQNHKRLTLVVSWRRAQNAAVSSRITMSSLLGSGYVTPPTSTPSPAPSPTPTPDASPAPTPTPASCPGDTTPPAGLSHSILSGAGSETGYTSSLTVSVRLEATDPCRPITAMLSNDAGGPFSDAGVVPDEASQTTVTWTVPGGDGTKTVYAKFRDGAGNPTTEALQASIVLDQTSPTVPADLRIASCGTQGQSRTVTLAWGSSTDANLSGYRLYRSLDSDPFAPVSTTASNQLSDASPKQQAVRYSLRAYDLAANESADSNLISLPKNECQT